MSSPTLTVKDVWRGVLPSGTDLLGGGGGLERRVEWACALRTRPPAFEAVKGGEIAFVPVKSIRLGGGGARSQLWRQIQADVYGHEVEIVEAEEGAAYGAAILAGVGAKIWRSVDVACDSVVRVVERIRPNPANAEVMEKNYAAYQRIYPAMKSIFSA